MAKVKITVESERNAPQTFECDGVAFIATTCNDEQKKYEDVCAIVGKLSTRDLIHLHDIVEKHLTPELKKQAVVCHFESLFGE